MPSTTPTRKGEFINPNLFGAFASWARDNSIDETGHEDDWGPWWDCWIDGFTKAQSIYYTGRDQSKEHVDPAAGWGD